MSRKCESLDLGNLVCVVESLYAAVFQNYWFFYIQRFGGGGVHFGLQSCSLYRFFFPVKDLVEVRSRNVCS